jgi:hypothetical protein
MKWSFFIVIIVVLAVSVHPLRAQSLTSLDFDSNDVRTMELRSFLTGRDLFAPDGSTVQTRKTKSTAIGILSSLAVPGSGEFYSKSWVKGAVFLGVEVALWIGYWQYSEKGQIFEDDFHAYADAHWSEEDWLDWMLNNPEFGDTTHTLPDTKTQQYYEMIGKYDQFKAGWDDYLDSGPDLTPNRNHYEWLRDKSNELFIKASYCTMLALGNRLLSVLDTAITIGRYNREIQGGVRMSMRRVHNDWVPFLALQVQW